MPVETKQTSVNRSNLGFKSAIVQQKTIVDASTRNTASTTFVTTGISATLDNNLLSTSSRVRIRFQATVGGSALLLVFFKLFRGVTDLTPNGCNCMDGTIVDSNNALSKVGFEFVDAPQNITPASYSIQWAVQQNTAFLGRRGLDGTVLFPSFLTIEEIAF